MKQGSVNGATDSPEATEIVEVVFPLSGERFVFRSPRSQLDRFEFDFFVEAAGGVEREHRHLDQTETFRCRSGTLSVTLDGEPCVVGPGETLVIEPGVAHTLRNEGATEVHCHVDYSPAGRNREWFQMIGAYTRRYGREPGLLDLGPFIGEVGIYISGPPIVVQRLLFRWVMRPLGIVLGRRRRMLTAARQEFGPSFAW
jgi:mannose-6-phosphate isomerase-like protein (cupin superfamily)